MILSKYVNIKISNNLINYYTILNYEFNSNEIIKVLVKDLPKNSSHKVKVKCDICNNEKEISLNRYIINTKNKTLPYACSRMCAEIKNKNTCLKKYGVDNISKLDFIKNKKEKTCLDNFDVKYPQQSNEIFLKSKKTKKEKYNNENYNNSKKRKKTNAHRNFKRKWHKSIVKIK